MLLSTTRQLYLGRHNVGQQIRYCDEMITVIDMTTFCEQVESGYRTRTDSKTQWMYLYDYAGHFEEEQRKLLREIDHHFFAATGRKYKVFGKEISSDSLCEQFQADIPRLKQGLSHYAN